MAESPTRNTARARELRNAATPAEKRLWNHLKQRQLAGAKFSRQMPIGPFFVDFVCRAGKLVIELDGHSHDFTVEEDVRRTRYIEGQGYAVLRFTNAEVRDDIDGVLAKIACALQPTPAASPPAPPASGKGEFDLLPSRSREGWSAQRTGVGPL